MNTNSFYDELEQFVKIVSRYCYVADMLVTSGVDPEISDIILWDELKFLHPDLRKIVWRLGPAMAYAQIVADDGYDVAAIVYMATEIVADTDSGVDPDDLYNRLCKAFPLTDPDLVHHLMCVMDGVASLMN